MQPQIAPPENLAPETSLPQSSAATVTPSSVPSMKENFQVFPVGLDLDASSESFQEINLQQN
ncbi:hypothetical protein [Fischerella thermalis]|uniref:hypothetical protein n=1 Tax=Fischerella thermalis TaxID=372787 RepID=UPI002155CAEA|nr:hypothetical protein [Fischerella thermalis]